MTGGAEAHPVLLPAADRWMYSSPARVYELRRWLRLVPDEPGYREDGLTAEALDMTLLQARVLSVALSPRVWAVLRRLGGPALLASSSRIRNRGTVVAFTVPDTDAGTAGLIGEQGRVLLRTWLAAHRQGLHVHPLSQVIDDPATARSLDSVVSPAAAESRRTLSVFRIGRPLRPPAASYRRGEPPAASG